MRLLHTSRDYYPDVSGVAEVTYQVTTELARRGHEVWVATGPTLDKSHRPSADGVHLRRFGIAGNSAIGIRGETEAYRDFVLSRQWDAVTIHSVVGWPIELLLPHLHRISGAKIVVNHSDAALRHAHRRAYRQHLGTVLRHVDRTVILSSRLASEDFYREFDLSAAAVIPNGVDLAQWGQAPLGIRKGTNPWLITVGNHSGVKRHDRFFEVMKLLRSSVPDAAGTIIGRSHPAERFGLGRIGIRGGCWYQCRASALKQSSVSLDRLSRAETVSAIQEADVLLLTSESEASPLVILESMAAGTPWISFDVGCVRDHVGGLVVGSCKEMAEASRCLLADPAYRSRLGAEGRARVRQRHQWPEIASKYEQLYQTVSFPVQA